MNAMQPGFCLVKLYIAPFTACILGSIILSFRLEMISTLSDGVMWGDQVHNV